MKKYELNTKNTENYVTLFVIIPIYNEVEVIPTLINRLNNVFSEEDCAEHGIVSVTFLFIDDGSVDNSAQLLFEHLQNTINSKIIRFSRNFGHQSAISAGLFLSNEADLTAIIDADLQDPPELILDMVDKWREGYDVIYGQRSNRKENPLRVLLHWLFYRLYQQLTPIKVPLDSGDFCLMSNRVVRELNKLPEKLRFPRGLRSWVGFRQTGIIYDRPKRISGKSKYNLRQLYQLATDGIASLSLRPLKVMQLFAFFYLNISLIALIYLFFSFINQDKTNLEFYILLATMLFSNSIIFFGLYILGAYIGRSYLEIKNRPTYIISEIIDLKNINGTDHV